MAFRSPTRTVDQLIKSRNAALKLRNGSPQFREVLRQRCRTKVKQNRQEFINLLRKPSGENELKTILTDTIQEELSCLADPCDPTSIRNGSFEISSDVYIENELRYLLDEDLEPDLSEKFGIEINDAEVDQIMQSYDAIVAADFYITSDLLDKDFIDVVECPICSKGDLILTESEILCSSCNFMLKAQTSLSELRNMIGTHLLSHSNVCPHKLYFNSDDNSLKMTCSVCSYQKHEVF